MTTSTTTATTPDRVLAAVADRPGAYCAGRRDESVLLLRPEW